VDIEAITVSTPFLFTIILPLSYLLCSKSVVFFLEILPVIFISFDWLGKYYKKKGLVKNENDKRNRK